MRCPLKRTTQKHLYWNRQRYIWIDRTNSYNEIDRADQEHMRVRYCVFHPPPSNKQSFQQNLIFWSQYLRGHRANLPIYLGVNSNFRISFFMYFSFCHEPSCMVYINHLQIWQSHILTGSRAGRGGGNHRGKLELIY